MTDFEDRVTLVVDLPGVSPDGRTLPQPELAASAMGQRAYRTSVKVCMTAMV